MGKKKRAGILYDNLEFEDSAHGARLFLEGQGYTAYMQGFSTNMPVEDLPVLLGPLDVLIWYSHGGWDGPLIFNAAGTVEYQVAPEETKEWAKLKAYFAGQMKPHGIFISHSCHSAGSNKWEDADMPSMADVRWVEEVSKDMNIYAVGVEGSTAAANRKTAVKLLGFALNGSRPPQASRAYSPGGHRVLNWKGWPGAKTKKSEKNKSRVMNP